MSTIYAEHEFAILLILGFLIFVAIVAAMEAYFKREEENDRAKRRKDQSWRYR